MGADGRYLEARLSFTGPNCATDYRDFERAVRQNPIGLLTHPIHGQWDAFCKGPTHVVDLAKSADLIEATVAWSETDTGRKAPVEIPDVATAQQNITATLQQYQQLVAEYMAKVALAQAPFPAQQLVLTATLDVLAVASSPIDAAQATINETMGSAPAVIAATQQIQVSANALSSEVTDFTTSLDDLFSTDTDGAPALAQSVDEQVQSLESSVADLVDTMIAASPAAAMAGDAVGSACELLDSCMTAADAVAAASPPVINYVVTTPTPLLVLAQRLIYDFEIDTDAATYAARVRNLNRVPFPATIPAGTELRVPAR
jgi:hypothetical protein